MYGAKPGDSPTRATRAATTSSVMELRPVAESTSGGEVGQAEERVVVHMTSNPTDSSPVPGSLEGRQLAYFGAASDSNLTCMTDSTDSNTDGAALLERKADMEKAGLAGPQPTAIWCGNIPENSSSESAIRLLFSPFGDIRRVFVRRKANPSRSWCLITYRSSASVKAALLQTIVAQDADGHDVQLVVELPQIDKELAKPKPGALGAVVAMALDDYDENPSPRDDAAGSTGNGGDASRTESDGTPAASPQTTDGSPTPSSADSGGRRKKRLLSAGGRRRSVVELEIRHSLSGHAPAESSSALKEEQGKGRSMWKTLRGSAFRNKLAVAALFVQNDDENEKAAKQAIKETLHDVRMEEIPITSTLKGLAQLYTGEMRGLDYRFKTEASLFRKVMARLDKALAEAAVSKGRSPPSPADILKSVLDILRYTVVFTTKRYTASVREMIAALKEHDYKQHRVKNYWGPGDGYQGINSVFVSPSGQAFELQGKLKRGAVFSKFHTPESLSMKEEECHSSYAKFRTATDSRKMMQYWEEMVSMWDMVPVPEGVLEIPQVVQQKLEFDLSKLSEEETSAIKHRKALERVCRYPVDELHSRAVKAEAEIGALMVYLMHKHGPGGACDQKEKRSAVRAQLSMLRQLVDAFIKLRQEDDNEDEPEVQGEQSASSSPEAATSPPKGLSRTASSARRSRAATMSDQAFDHVSVGVKLASQVRVASVDIKSLNGSGTPTTQSVDEASMPDEPTVRDKLRELEQEFPPLKYKIVCSNEQLYTTIVHGFLRDIASDSDYEIYAVNNWWDDLEKFGAVNARFLAVRHGLRFEVTFHTELSWDASTEHNEYMRRKFDTVIKTDVLFTDNPQMVDEVKSQMRREEMWRERWARISVPDRALTIGTLRYAHVRAPDAAELNSEAQAAVGRSHSAVNRLQRAANKVRVGVRLAGGGSTAAEERGVGKAAHGSSSMVYSRERGMASDDDVSRRDRVEDGGVGGSWAEIVGAFFEERREIAELFETFKREYLAEKGEDSATWQPLASRFAGLEKRMAELQAQIAGSGGGKAAAALAVVAGNGGTTSNGTALENNWVQAKPEGKAALPAADGTRKLSFVPMVVPPGTPTLEAVANDDNDNDMAAAVVTGGAAAASSSAVSEEAFRPTLPFPKRAHASSIVSSLRSAADDNDDDDGNVAGSAAAENGAHPAGQSAMLPPAFRPVAASPVVGPTSTPPRTAASPSSSVASTPPPTTPTATAAGVGLGVGVGSDGAASSSGTARTPLSETLERLLRNQEAINRMARTSPTRS